MQFDFSLSTLFIIVTFHGLKLWVVFTPSAIHCSKFFFSFYWSYFWLCVIHVLHYQFFIAIFPKLLVIWLVAEFFTFFIFYFCFLILLFELLGFFSFSFSSFISTFFSFSIWPYILLISTKISKPSVSGFTQNVFLFLFVFRFLCVDFCPYALFRQLIQEIYA